MADVGNIKSYQMLVSCLMFIFSSTACQSRLAH